MKSKPSVLILGSSYTDQGGIGSVFKTYKNQGFLDDKCYLVTYKKGTLSLRLYTFTVFILQFIHQLIFNPNLRIIHAHLSQRGSFFRKMIILFFGKLFQKRVIFHLHGSEFLLFFRNSPKPIQAIIRKVFNACDAVIVLSNSWKFNLREITTNRNIHVVYNPIVIPEQQKDYRQERLSKPNFLFMGNLGKRKGVYDLIEAVDQIKEPNFTISLYGDGELEKVKELVRSKNLQDVIRVSGWISGPLKEEAFKAADLLLLPSYNEGLPMSILEALACGMPVLSTTVGGIPEAIEHNVNGFLIEPGDVDDLAHYLKKVSTSPAILQQLSSRAYQRAVERFDHHIIFQQLERLYQSVLNPPPPSTFSSSHDLSVVVTPLNVDSRVPELTSVQS